jgi:hypothetical protein
MISGVLRLTRYTPCPEPGKAMRRRSRTRGEPAKTRRKTAAPKRGNAPKAAVRRSPPADRHRNVDWWVHNPTNSRAVRGWVFFDLIQASFFFGRRPFVRFTAHSVVEDADGTLYDITPSRASRRYPFIRHEGSEEEFNSLVEENRLVNLDLEIT